MSGRARKRSSGYRNFPQCFFHSGIASWWCPSPELSGAVAVRCPFPETGNIRSCRQTSTLGKRRKECVRILDK